MENEKKSLFKTIIELAPLIIALLGVAGTFLNFYLTSRLVPLADSINAVAQKADSFYSVHTNDVSRNEFIIIEIDLRNIQKQLDDLHAWFFGRSR